MATTYIPGFTPSLTRDDLLRAGPTGGPALDSIAAQNGTATISPSAPPIMQGVQPSPTAPPIMQGVQPSPSAPPMMDLSFLSGLGGLSELAKNPAFIGTGLGGLPTQQLLDLGVDPATGLMLNKSRTVELNGAGQLQREVTPEGSMPGVYFTNDQGIAATTGLGKNAANFTALDPNAIYRVIDERTGEVVSQGVGAAGLKAAQDATLALRSGGRKSNWQVQAVDQTTGDSRVVANVDPRKSDFGAFTDIALPIALSFAVPGLGLVGGGLGAGLGAAAGSGISSALQGRSLKDSLIRAGLSGVAAGGLSALGGAVSGAGSAGSALANGAASTAGAGLSGVGDIIVTAARGALGSALGGGLGAGLGSAAGSALNNPAVPRNQQPGDIVVSASRPVAPNPLAPVIGGAASGIGSAVVSQPGDIIVEGQRPQSNPLAPILAGGGALGVGGAALSGGGGGANDILVEANRPQPAAPTAPVSGIGSAVLPPPSSNDIVVEADRPKPELPVGLPLGGAAVIPPMTNAPATQPDVPKPDKNSTLDDIIKYLRAAGLLSSLFGGTGGSTGGLGRLPAGGGLNSVFSGGLPKPTIPGASDNFAQRPADYDWKRYGYGPGQSFFNYVPQGQPNTSTAYTGYAEGGEVEGMGHALGEGNSFAVQGPGSGRDDKIPSLLSDGEYVIDAETVALIGDGSSKAGADRLDQFRVNIRKHKGAQLAKGGISPDAKAPEQYLIGGR